MIRSVRQPWLLSRVAPLLALAAMIGGCSSLQPCAAGDLRDSYGLTCVVRGLEEPPPVDRRGCLIGKVAGTVEQPIVVVAYREQESAVEVVAWSVLVRPGPYRLAVPPGTYRLAAFHDADGDRRYDPAKEAAAVYHDGGGVVVMPRKRVDRLYLTLRDDGRSDAGALSLQRIAVEPSDEAAAGACAAS